MKIYVVSGASGEWSEREEWIVSAFTSEQMAEKRVTELHQWRDYWVEKKRNLDIKGREKCVENSIEAEKKRIESLLTVFSKEFNEDPRKEKTLCFKDVFLNFFQFNFLEDRRYWVTETELIEDNHLGEFIPIDPITNY